MSTKGKKSDIKGSPDVEYNVDRFEELDVKKKPDVNVRYNSKGNKNEFFSIILSGKSIDRSVANAVRRTVISSIPVYGFHRSNIHIDNSQTNSMLNNHMLFTRFEMLPIFDCPDPPTIVDPKVYLNNDSLRKLFGHIVRMDSQPDESLKKKIHHIEISLQYKNTTSELYCLSSHDAVLRINGKVVKNFSDRPKVCLFYLRPGESVSMSAVSNLGIEDMHAIYEVTTNPVSLELSVHEYSIAYEAIGNMDKATIFRKACEILQNKCNKLAEYIETNREELNGTNIVELQGEDHTLGNLITTTLQRCSKVKTAAYKQPHATSNFVQIEFICFDETERLDILIDCVKYVSKIYKMIEEQFSKL